MKDGPRRLDAPKRTAQRADRVIQSEDKRAQTGRNTGAGTAPKQSPTGQPGQGGTPDPLNLSVKDLRIMVNRGNLDDRLNDLIEREKRGDNAQGRRDRQPCRSS